MFGFYRAFGLAHGTSSSVIPISPKAFLLYRHTCEREISTMNAEEFRSFDSDGRQSLDCFWLNRDSFQSTRFFFFFGCS
jgi:hypothetical protein